MTMNKYHSITIEYCWDAGGSGNIRCTVYEISTRQRHRTNMGCVELHVVRLIGACVLYIGPSFSGLDQPMVPPHLSRFLLPSLQSPPHSVWIVGQMVHLAPPCIMHLYLPPFRLGQGRSITTHDPDQQ